MRPLEVGGHLRVGPVEVRLLGGEQVQVPLAVRDPGPGRAAEEGLPVVRRLGAVLARPVPEDVPPPGRAVRLRAAPRRTRRAGRRSWLGTRSTVTLRPCSCASRDQRVEAGQVAEERVDVARVGHVVAVVGHRGGVERGQPERVHAEQVQVAEPLADAGQVTHAVAVAVGEAADVDLVEDGGPPPRCAAALRPGSRSRGCRASGARVSSAIWSVAVPGRRVPGAPAGSADPIRCGSSPTGSACCAPPSPGSARASARARPAARSDSTASRMCRSQASRSRSPIANGACRIRSRGCPRRSEYVRGPPQYCTRNIRSRSSAGPRSCSG